MLHNNLAFKTVAWKAAIYVRISEEERIKSFGDSITNQKQILTEYANKKALEVVKVFTDEGQKGGNFNRPAFKAMLSEIENGTINCVVVKDLSRFGREHIEGDYYLEKLFPSKGVRFISLLERIDSVADPERMNSIEVPIINLFNEQYLRQVSNSTKASLKIKRKEGKYVTPIVPYGYLRSPEDKYKLIPDEYAKPIVEDIFSLYLSYISLSKIARILDNRDILSPVLYRQKLKGNPINKASEWSHSTVRTIITNPIYTGDMVQGRSYSYNHKIGKREPIPKEQWAIVENTHEAIIDKENFEIAQSLITHQSRPTIKKNNTMPSILAGFLICKDCSKQMQRKISPYQDKNYYNFLCSTYNKLGKDTCSSHLVREDVIHDILLTTINTIIKGMIDVEQAIKEKKKVETNHMVAKLEYEISSTKAETEKIEKLKAGLYSDYKLEIITLKDYKGMKERFENNSEKLKERVLRLEKQIKTFRSKIGLNSQAVTLFRQYEGIQVLTRKIISNLVNKIIVDKDRNITINFKFQDEIKKYCSFFEM